MISGVLKNKFEFFPYMHISHCEVYIVSINLTNLTTKEQEECAVNCCICEVFRWTILSFAAIDLATSCYHEPDTESCICRSSSNHNICNNMVYTSAWYKDWNVNSLINHLIIEKIIVIMIFVEISIHHQIFYSLHECLI